MLRQAKAKAQEEDAKARQVFQGAFRSTDQVGLCMIYGRGTTREAGELF